MDKKERAVYRRRHRRWAGFIGCEVWEQSGIGVKGGLAWFVTSDAINSAVNLTYQEDISDADWIAAAVEVYKASWPSTSASSDAPTAIPVRA